MENTAEIQVLQESPVQRGGVIRLVTGGPRCAWTLLLPGDCLVKIESGLDRER